ncbi:MAG TPA: nucleoside hydrolase [Candidatus Hydrogenedentes bacterium]|nr:nucleoside hydrolase [Candidatus Hydrogenedentota bacterium]
MTQAQPSTDSFIDADTVIPVILDTDIGDDIDDTWALAMALGRPELALRLIVTGFGDTSARTRLVAKMLERMDRMDVPIGTGVATGSAPIHQMRWAGEYEMTRYPGVVHRDGVGAMIDVIHAEPGPVVVLSIGPMTNLKAALERDPGIARKVRVVAMAGSVRTGYGPGSAAEPEYNVFQDVAAARAVFAAPWPITLAPLDSCMPVALSGNDYKRVENAASDRARVVIENYDLWSRREEFGPEASSVLFDCVAAYLCWEESLCVMEDMRLVIDDAGCTVETPEGRPVRCAMDWKDLPAFKRLLIESLL